MSAYELERLERIEANKRRMAQLGVLEHARTLARDARENKRKKTKASADFREGDAAPVRASRRVRNEEPEAYDPNDASRDLFEVRYNEEVYEARHAEALGSAAEPWTLFEDGYDDKGRRIYDPSEWAVLSSVPTEDERAADVVRGVRDDARGVLRRLPLHAAGA